VELDRRPDPLVQREAVLGVADGELEDVADAPGPELAQEQQPGSECPRHAGGEHAGSRHELVPELPEALDRRRGGSDALPAEHERLAALVGPEHGRDLSTGTVEMRLDDLQDEPGRDRCIEGVAAPLEHPHPGLRGEPVRGRDHPEGAAQLGTRRERHARSLRKGALAAVRDERRSTR
jgi:hypothetical protein